MKKLTFTIVIFLLSFSFISCKKEEAVKPDTSKAEAEALKAANKWLSLIDRGKFSKAYDKASSIIKKQVSEEEFTKSIEGTLEPLKEFRNREVIGKQYATTLPGVPDGEYVVIRYKSRYEKKKKAIETVTPSKERDGSWKVSGYYIK